ncbi:MAG TPA: nicotinamide riboside transporter PnuC, partial [Chitinophagaceae bacterium]|nr:nicotinamide riboside transporter PnuC [Chitinophagaceae bacterium]
MLIDIIDQFLRGMKNTTALEYIAVFAGIASVWFSRIENILVYPVGLINTIIYIYISINGSLYGEASVNLYYTIMSIYGWLLWAKRNDLKQHVVVITHSNNKELLGQFTFFAAFYIVI